MVSVSEIFANVKAILKKSGIDDYRFDAECIIEQALGAKLPILLTDASVSVTDEVIAKIREMTNKRTQGYPLQYILGEWEFMGLPFKVGEGVLIPRQDTESMVGFIIEKYSGSDEKLRVVDLCSGSGCIAVSIKKNLPNADVTAVELSEDALKYLRLNAVKNDTDIKIMSADVLSEQTSAKFIDIDLIVCNPPYLSAYDMENLQKEVSFEPSEALFGGADGLDYYRKIIPMWKNSLKVGGRIMFEIGATQNQSVEDILNESGYEQILCIKDCAGNFRIETAIRKQQEA